MIAVSASVVSCLDMTPTDRVSDKVLWEKTETAEYNVNYLYTYIYDILMTQSKAGQVEALTDQMKYGSYGYNKMALIPSEFSYGDGTTLTASYVDAYMGMWNEVYQGITKTNVALSCLKSYGKMSDEDKVRLEAELRFIRGYLYFDLMKRYKEIILYNEDMSAYSKDKELSSESDGWDFVYADFKFAADNLPAREAANGRINKGMAWGFITRAMLYAERWDLVKEAAKEVKDLGYALEEKYEDSYMKSVAAGNNEAILQYLFDRTQNVTHSFDFYYTPGGDYTIHGEAGGGYGTPTQEMVESYELATGGFMDWTPWHDTNTANPPYDKLEPRFHATILYNGASWKGRKIESFVGGADGFCAWNIEPEPKGRSTTGYYLRKLVDENHDVIAHSGGVQPLIVMRYGEVLLNLAEACYRTGDDAGANAAVKAIRSRVNLPYTDKSGTELWEAIRQERKVELAYEGMWYWDLRRWKLAHKKYPEGLSGYQLHGLKISKTGDDPVTGEPTYRYEYVSVDDKNRNFPEKLYQFPLPSGELESNSKIVSQYEGWR